VGGAPVEVEPRCKSTASGAICPTEDRKENDFSLEHGFRLLSAYRTHAGDKLWIITESDRSVTTLLLPEEY
jgi:hypothetical protein